MSQGRSLSLSIVSAVVLAAVVSSLPSLYAQGRGGQPAGPPPTARAASPIDLTGYWVAEITEDWLSKTM